MRTNMRVLFLFAGGLLASAACSSQTVEKVMGCSDPCCGGNSALVDCGENPNISCPESGDPCTAQTFGCVGGVFFRKPPAMLPANCAATDSGVDATTDDGPFFFTDDGSGPTDDGGLDATTDGATDAMDEGADGAMLFACGDASCSSASQYCRHTVGGAPPGIDTQLCQPLDQGQSICAPEASSGGCQCSEDAGDLYVRCDVP